MTNYETDISDFSMLDLFRMEVETQAVKFNENLLGLEADPENSRCLEALMRAAHSIKGAARIVQLDVAVTIAHVMEDCFVAAKSGTITLTPDRIDILLKGVDLIDRISQVKEPDMDRWLSEYGADINRQKQAIEDILKSKSTSKSTEYSQSGISSDSTSSSTSADRSRQCPDSTENTSSSSESKIEAKEQPLADSNTKLAKKSRQSPASINPSSSSSEVKTEPQSFEGSEKTDTAKNPITKPAVDEARSSDEKAIVPVDKINGEISVASSSSKMSQMPQKSERANAPDSSDRVVRVIAENLNRLMGLAGESLVEANWLEPFGDSLLTLKKQQLELAKTLEKLEESLLNDSLSYASDDSLKMVKYQEQQCRQFLSDRLAEFDRFSQRFAQLSERLYQETVSSKMHPFSQVSMGFPRLIRDLARKLGKQVKFEMIGKSTQVDRDILEKIEAPLIHVLQNAVFHGIESPEKRLSAGKCPEGLIRLEVTHRGGMLSITISDDGRGIKLKALRKFIVKKNSIAQEMADRLSENELMDFLFLPGFSTVTKVNEVSGRGVGLDIAKNIVEELGGLLRAVSRPGQGMMFHFQLPLTLSVVRTLLVEISGEAYAFPLSRIEQIVKLYGSDILQVQSHQYFTFYDDNIGLVSAHQVLELPKTSLRLDALTVVVIGDRVNRYGVAVDRLIGDRDLVVRPLDPRLGKVRDISAAALREDGSPVLILDVEDMICSIEKLFASGQVNLIQEDRDSADAKRIKKVLVVDDSITVRQMERKLLENYGYQVDVAVDGMDGWNAVRTVEYDLIITDVDMPRMNGIELVDRIKNHPKLKSIPAIIVSYKDRDEDRLLGLEVGANYYLTKSSFHDNTFLQAAIDTIGEPIR